MESALPNSQSHTEFVALVERVRRGDEPAAAELIERYERAVLRTVRSRLGKDMRRALDTMDVVQSVHRSLLVGLRHQKFDVSTPNQLIGLAVVMVRRKVARHWRKLKHEARTGIDSAAAGSADTSAGGQFAAPDPTPADEAAAHDLFQHFLARLDAVDRRLLELRLEGYSTAEAAAILGRDPAFLRMRLARVRQKLREAGLLDRGI